jgi:glycosyltransferase involved in cell wall biosynthesis
MRESKMNESICFISPKSYNYFKPELSEEIGGAERQQTLIGERLVKKGYDISFIVEDFSEPDIEVLSSGIKLIKTVPRNSPAHSPSYISGLFLGMYKANADIYYIRGLRLPPAPSTMFCKFNSKKLILAISNDSDLEKSHLRSLNPLVRYLFKGTVKMADSVVSQTERQKNMLLDEFNRESTIIPNGYDIPHSRDLVDHSDRSYIIWVGRMVKDQKKPHLAIELAKKIPSVKFLLIGPSGGDPNYHDRIKKEVNSTSNVEYKGFVPPNEVHKYFQNALMYINTSDYEGFPNTFLEAWRYSTPVISLKYSLSTNKGEDSPEIVSGSIEQMVNDIKELCDNKTFRQKLGEKGRRHVETKYSLTTVVNEYEKLVRNI